ncbi:TniQ family protein [Brevibacillus sp. 7WMA2]|uniref:TniQ family protein n=1 Tax=Brevibacillus sp. 7WMA2 TaxID=2683193 RepID=UPI0013A7605E|nr:TniQ family protein [Brevibacillus sp. 7WMA2]QIC07174.1 TniQ family protein [Brevibacillus sp. 7WMA2]
MSQKFTVRPRMRKVESLTSYILRVGTANYFDYKRILKMVNTKRNNKDIWRRTFRFDVFVDGRIDMFRLSKLLKISEYEIQSMTFMPLVNKLIEEGHYTSEQILIALPKLIEINKRYFCPLCLKEQGYYKLLWQVKEIDMCNIHLCRLQSSCQNCMELQPYISENLAIMQCKYCHSKLTTQGIQKIEDEKEINYQSEKYIKWNYMLNKKSRIAPRITGVPSDKIISYSILYAANAPEEEYNFRKIKSKIREDYIHRIIRFVNGEDSPQHVTFPQLINILEALQISIHDFAQLKVPPIFIRSIPKNQDTRNKHCLTPWCSSYKTNVTMRKIEHISHLQEKKIRYYNAHVCTNCFMKYGINAETEEWQQVGNRIVKIELVRDLLNFGINRKQIHRDTKIPEKELTEIFGYLVQHKLLRSDLCEQYTPTNQPEDLVSVFKQLINESGTLFKNAKKMFGMSRSEYFYYFSSKKVQYYFLFESYEDKKRYKRVSKGIWTDRVLKELKEFKQKDQEISIKYIAASLNCTPELLGIYGLREIIDKAREEQRKCRLSRLEIEYRTKIDRYFDQCEINNKGILFKDIYELIGRRQTYIKEYMPKLSEWISTQVKNYKNKRHVDKRK